MARTLFIFILLALDVHHPAFAEQGGGGATWTFADSAVTGNPELPVAEDRLERLEQELRDAHRERDVANIHADLIDRQTSWFEILISVLMGGFSLIVSGVVIIFTFRFGKAAVQEAKQAIAAETAEIRDLLEQAKTAVSEIDANRDKAHQLLADISPSDVPKDEATRDTLRELAMIAASKPRAERTADDFRALTNVAAIDEDWIAVERRAAVMAYLYEDDHLALAFALIARGFALGQLGRPDDELATYDEVIRRFGDNEALALKEQVAAALVNKGVTLGQLERFNDELATYDEVIRRFGDSHVTPLQERLATALVYKGITLTQLGRLDDALAAYNEVIRRFNESDAPEMQEAVSNALFNAAGVHGREARVEDSIAALTDWAANTGSFDCRKVSGDTDFDLIRNDPQFAAFLLANGCAPTAAAPKRRARKPKTT